jgi:hypothetical protein
MRDQRPGEAAGSGMAGIDAARTRMQLHAAAGCPWSMPATCCDVDINVATIDSDKVVIYCDFNVVVGG